MGIGGSQSSKRADRSRRASRERQAQRANSCRLYHAVPPGCNDYRLAYRGFLLKSEPGNIFLSTEPGTLFCNIFYLAKTYATSANTFGKKTSAGIRLPSGAQLKGINLSLATNFVKKQTPLLGKKSSTFFFKKKRISVRGVAKNSVDHKHGGKGRGGVLRNFQQVNLIGVQC